MTTDKPDSSLPRKRGGQPGNKNALKHGYYAVVNPHLRAAILNRPAAGYAQEFAILADFIQNLQTLATPDADLKQTLTTLNGIALATTAIARLRRAQLYHTQTAPLNALATLTQAVAVLREQNQTPPA